MNTIRTSILSLILICGAILVVVESNFARADEKPETAKVVFHADYANPQRMSAMLTSIFNMVTTYENEFIEYDIRIVFLSHGIQFLTHDRLKGTPFAESSSARFMPSIPVYGSAADVGNQVSL